MLIPYVTDIFTCEKCEEKSFLGVPVKKLRKRGIFFHIALYTELT
jgi:hypothetical protein